MDGGDQVARDAIADIRLNMVRSDVYNAQKDGLIARVLETEKDLLSLEGKVDKSDERRAADRRLILTSLVLPILVAIILLYVQSQVGGQ